MDRGAFPAVEAVKVFAVDAEDAVKTSHPEPAVIVFDDLVDAIAKQSLAGSISGEFAVLEAIEAAARGANPEVAFTVFVESAGRGVRQTVSRCEPGKGAVPQPPKAVVGSDPKVAFVVLKDGPDRLGGHSVVDAERLECFTAQAEQAGARPDPASALPVFINHSNSPASHPLLRGEVPKSIPLQPEQPARPIGSDPKPAAAIFQEAEHEQRSRFRAAHPGNDSILQPVDAPAPSACPEGAVPALEDGDNIVAGEPLLLGVTGEALGIEANQAVAGANPQVVLPVLEDGVDQIKGLPPLVQLGDEFSVNKPVQAAVTADPEITLAVRIDAGDDVIVRAIIHPVGGDLAVLQAAQAIASPSPNGARAIATDGPNVIHAQAIGGSKAAANAPIRRAIHAVRRSRPQLALSVLAHCPDNIAGQAGVPAEGREFAVLVSAHAAQRAKPEGAITALEHHSQTAVIRHPFGDAVVGKLAVFQPEQPAAAGGNPQAAILAFVQSQGVDVLHLGNVALVERGKCTLEARRPTLRDRTKVPSRVRRRPNGVDGAGHHGACQPGEPYRRGPAAGLAEAKRERKMRPRMGLLIPTRPTTRLVVLLRPLGGMLLALPDAVKPGQTPERGCVQRRHLALGYPVIGTAALPFQSRYDAITPKFPGGYGTWAAV